jgi:hypothetical protein
MTNHHSPTVPVGIDGLEGWTSCCDAAVTYGEIYAGEFALCCKGCWSEVEIVTLDGDAATELSTIVRDVIDETITADEGVARQHALLDR